LVVVALMIRFELALALLLVGAFIRATLAVRARAKVRSLGLEDEPPVDPFR